MKEAIIPIKNEVLITSRCPDNNYRDLDRIIIGRENIDEIRSYINININSSLNKLNVYKAELLLYLEEIDLKSESNCLMLNIGIIFDNVKDSEITWNNAPKFYQECLLYKVREKDKNKYIRFDITALYEKYILKGKYPCGFMLLCFNANAIATFASIKSEKKGHIVIYYNNEGENIPENNDIKDNKEIKKDSDEKAYGQFYSTDGKIVKSGALWRVIINKEINNKCMNLEKGKGYIKINKPGIYNVIYSCNYRSNELATMALSLNENIIQSSIVQIGSNEGVSTGHCIIKTNKNDETLKLVIYGNDILSIDIGVSANLTVVEI